MPKPTKAAPNTGSKAKPEARLGAVRKNSRKCEICGAEVAPISEESLCWVCRRLKVSAWNEGIDSQMFAAE